jgi:hypothetical protein
MLVIPSLNQAFDLATVSRSAAVWHHPMLVVVSLIVVSLLYQRFVRRTEVPA